MIGLMVTMVLVFDMVVKWEMVALVFGMVAATVNVHLRPPRMVPSDSGPQVALQVVLVMDWLGWKTK